MDWTDEYYRTKVDEIRSEVRSVFDNDNFSTMQENVRWLYTSLKRCLEVIDLQSDALNAQQGYSAFLKSCALSGETPDDFDTYVKKMNQGGE
jgi:hypothetical protein